MAVLLDIGCVLVFVIIGRASHAKGETLAGITSTAWPFLTGLACGWLASGSLADGPLAGGPLAGGPLAGARSADRAWRRPAALAPAGVAAWLGTVTVGMVLRVISGQGTAFAFICVALAFLGLFMLGWRLAAAHLPRLSTP
jgi:DUF3054 family protein